MLSWQNGVAVVVLLTVGGLVAVFGTGDLRAQQSRGEVEAWEIHHGAYMAQSDNARFYVVRHNRVTGETQYIGCEDRQGCTQLKVEIAD